MRAFQNFILVTSGNLYRSHICNSEIQKALKTKTIFINSLAVNSDLHWHKAIYSLIPYLTWLLICLTVEILIWLFPGYCS